MSLKTISEWQRRSKNDQTRVLKSLCTFNCGQCAQKQRSKNSVEHTMVVCSSGGSVDFFCSGCWDEEEWTCPDCNQVPADTEVIGCEQCGQWTHNNCQQVIDTSSGYICLDCQTSDLKTLKETIFDKQVALSNATTNCREWKQKFETMSKAQQHTDTMLKQTTTDLNKLKKQHSAKFVECEKRVTQQRRQFDAVSTQMNTELAQLRRTKQLCKNEILKLQAVEKRLTSSVKTTTAANAKLTIEIQCFRKRTREHSERQREHDGMVNMMQDYVKRHKSGWSYTPPPGLGTHDLMLWNLYQCKSRSNNNTMIYSANKMSSTHGDNVEWKSIGKILFVMRKLYQKKN